MAHDVTRLLRDARAGDARAFDRLWPLVYGEVKQLAQAQLRRERPGHTLHATGLVHEAYLKLADASEVAWRGRAQFFAIAARAMRQILVDHARRRDAQKRGGDWQRTTLTGHHPSTSVRMGDLLALDEALRHLGDRNARLSDVVEMRFFGGMTEQEIADVLGVSKRTVQRDWAKARAWLYTELYPDPS